MKSVPFPPDRAEKVGEGRKGQREPPPSPPNPDHASCYGSIKYSNDNAKLETTVPVRQLKLSNFTRLAIGRYTVSKCYKGAVD